MTRDFHRNAAVLPFLGKGRHWSHFTDTQSCNFELWAISMNMRDLSRSRYGGLDNISMYEKSLCTLGALTDSLTRDFRGNAAVLPFLVKRPRFCPFWWKGRKWSYFANTKSCNVELWAISMKMRDLSRSRYGGLDNLSMYEKSLCTLGALADSLTRDFRRNAAVLPFLVKRPQVVTFYQYSIL